MKFQMKDGFAQVPVVEPIASRHVELLFGLAAETAEKFQRFDRPLRGERQAATLATGPGPGLKALPTPRANGSTARLLEFLFAEKAIGWEHYGTQTTKQVRKDGVG